MSVLAAVALACVLPLTSCDSTPATAPVEQAVGLPLDAPRVSVESTGEGEKKVLSFADIGQEQTVHFEATDGFAQETRKQSTNLRASTLAQKALKQAVQDTQKDLPQNDSSQGDKSAFPDAISTSMKLSGKVDEATEDVEGQAPASRNVFLTATDTKSTSDDSEAVATADGFQVGWRATDTGQMNSIRLAAPTEAKDASRSEVERALLKLTALPIVLPSEPIGVGAKWTVDSRVTGDSTMLQSTTYTLTAWEGTTATLDVDIAQRPALGALSMEGRTSDEKLAESTLDVKDSATATSGTINIDTTKPLPTNGNVDLVTTVIYGTEGSATRVVQNFRTGLKFS